MNIVYALVFVVCFNGECEEYVLDTLPSMADCGVSLMLHAPEISNYDETGMYALSCEKTIVEKA